MKTLIPAIIFAVVMLAIYFFGHRPDGNTAAKPVDNKPKLGYEIINVSPIGSTMWKMEVKLTNVNNITIKSAKGTAVLMDNTGREICIQTHYIVKDDLPPGAVTYFTFIIDCNQKPASYKLHIERIR